MKTREGFVSNSSSSSFIVAFPHKPKNVEDLKSMMFPEKGLRYITYLGEYKINVDNCVDRVFRDIKNLKCITEDKVSEALRSGYDEFLIAATSKEHEIWKKLSEWNWDDLYWKRYHEIMKELNIDNSHKLPKRTEKNKDLLDELKKIEKKHMNECDERWQKEDKMRKKLSKKSAKKLMNDFKEKWVVIVSYSDNEKGETVMEHGNIFRNLDHVRISHH